MGPLILFLANLARPLRSLRLSKGLFLTARDAKSARRILASDLKKTAKFYESFSDFYKSLKFIILYLYSIKKIKVKRIALISVLATYLVLNLGISIKLHYCGDSISFIDFFPVEEKNCCKDKKATCCKDKIAYINPETTQHNTQVVSFDFPDYSKYNFIIQDFSFLSFLETDKVKERDTGPGQNVFYRKVPLYLYHRVIIV